MKTKQIHKLVKKEREHVYAKVRLAQFERENEILFAKLGISNDEISGNSLKYPKIPDNLKKLF